MAEERHKEVVRPRADKAVGGDAAQRSLTGSGALQFAAQLAEAGATAFTVGASGAAGVHVVNQVLGRPKEPPPPEVVLPPGASKE